MTIPAQAGLAKSIGYSPVRLWMNPFWAIPAVCQFTRPGDGPGYLLKQALDAFAEVGTGENIPLDRPRMCFMSRLYEARHGYSQRAELGNSICHPGSPSACWLGPRSK
jgi:hypothetical protein